LGKRTSYVQVKLLYKGEKGERMSTSELRVPDFWKRYHCSMVILVITPLPFRDTRPYSHLLTVRHILDPVVQVDAS